MSPKVYIGLDVHRKSITATALDPEGRRLDQSRIRPDDAAVVEYLGRFEGDKHIALEACSVWEHVYDAAATVTDSVVLAHPSKTRLIAEANLQSDKVDSLALAELLRLNGLPKAFVPDKTTRDLRQLVRDRRHVKRLQTAVKNHIYAILLRRGIAYEDGLLGLKRKREHLRELKMPAVDRGLDLLANLEDACGGFDDAIEEAYNGSREAQLLRTIPGIGPLTAVTLVAELCPINRFSNVDKVCSYAGLVPTNHQSGEVSYQGRLKKRDRNPLLTEVLVEAAWVHRRHAKTSDVSKVGRRVSRRRGAGKGSAAAAHKLLKIVYAVLRRGTPYVPERPSRVRVAAES